MDEPQQQNQPDRVVGRYALYGKLAAGGMATVHFGRLVGPAGFSRTVAIKRLHPQFAKDPEFVAMFLDEARLAARIQHPNVVATVDVVAKDEELFLVMDYIRGESFSRLLRASRRDGIEVPIGVIASVVSGMLDGLHAAHEAKDELGRPLCVVHRDVSPQNVLVGVDGVPRVLDFGVAKAAARLQITRDGQMKGKLSYMAPEQLQHRAVDRRTDVFAAGVVLWEALTGRRLFDAEEPAEVLRMIISEEIPPPSAVLPSITRAMDATVMKALSRNSDDRYPTARAFGLALEEASPLASPRIVGAWVEKVAGATLLRREQAVAVMESVGQPSDASLSAESSPGFLKTLDGLAPPPPDATVDWDEGPTSVYEPPLASSPTSSRRDETSVQVPRPLISDVARAPDPPAPEPISPAPVQPLPEAPAPIETHRVVAVTPAEPKSIPPPKPSWALRSSRPPRPRSHGELSPQAVHTRESEVAIAMAPAPVIEPPFAPLPVLERDVAHVEESFSSSTLEAAALPAPAPTVPIATEAATEVVRVAEAARAVEAAPAASVESADGAPSSGERAVVPDPSQGFDDSNETTAVYDSASRVAESEAAVASASSASKESFDDENEVTTVYPDSQKQVDPVPTVIIADAAAVALPRETDAAYRARLDTLKVERRPVSTMPPAGPGHLERTNPAMFRQRSRGPIVDWFWADPRERAFRVGAVAAIVAFIGVFLFTASRGKHATPDVAALPVAPEIKTSTAVDPAPRPEPAAQEPVAQEPVAQEPLPAAVETPKTEPAEGADTERTSTHEHAKSHARVHVAPPPAAPATVVPSASVAATETAAPEALPAAAAPAPEPPKPEPDFDDPYKPIENPYTTKLHFESGSKNSSSGTNGANAPAHARVDCTQPFTIDEQGIKHPRPECLR